MRAAMAQVEEWPDALRDRRAYVLASEEWHEGVIGIVASRLVERYHRPVVLIAGRRAGMEGLRPLDSGVRPPRWPERVLRLARAVRRPPRRSGPLDPSESGSTSSPRRSPTMPRARSRDDDLRRVTRIDAVVPRGVPLTLGLCAELARLAPVRARQPKCDAARAGVRARRSGRGGGGQAPALPRARQRRASTAARRSASAWAAQLDRYRRPGLYDVAFRLQENRWNGTVAPQLVVQRLFDTPDRYREVRAWFADEFKKASGRDRLAEEVFHELRLEGGARRSLLESERFRELLVDQPLPRAA